MNWAMVVVLMLAISGTLSILYVVVRSIRGCDGK